MRIKSFNHLLALTAIFATVLFFVLGIGNIPFIPSRLSLNLGFAVSAMDETDDVQDIARATTVLIAESLEEGQVETASEDANAGSGVIFSRELAQDQYPLSNTKVDVKEQLYYHYVLTNAHVVKPSDKPYGIRTSDGRVYSVQALDADGQNIYRFGRNSRDDEFLGTDLAVIRFKSHIQYPLAAFGDSNSGDSANVLISGWPEPQSEDKKRQRYPIEGELLTRVESGSVPGNYTLRYTALSDYSMSGGPVFNERGQLIGIHGRRSMDGGPRVSYAIDTNQFIDLQQSQSPVESAPYGAVFNIRASIGALPDRYAVEFGKKVKGVGDNLTEAEYARDFSLLGVLPNDPARQAIERLYKEEGCLVPDGRGRFAPGLYEERGVLVMDLNRCTDRMANKITEMSQRYVKQEDLNTLMQSVELLAEQVKAVAAHSRNSGNAAGATVPNPARPSSSQGTTNSGSFDIATASTADLARRFTFTNVLQYSECLEDVLQLYHNPQRFQQQGRRSQCLADVFQQNIQGISQDQSLALIQAADYYATSLRSPGFYPPAGMRRRINQEFGYTYRLDEQ